MVRRAFAGVVILLAFAALLMASSLPGVGARRAAAPGPGVSLSRGPEPAHPDLFYEAEHFSRGLREVRSQLLPSARGTLIGGLVPHHALAGALFTLFFVELERQPPDTLIVIGPNHDNRGTRIATSTLGWSTPFGRVDPDLALIQQLVDARLAIIDDPALTPEHSIGALMPYLKYHAPEARVVPLILHRDVTLVEQRQIAEFLAPLLGRERVLVASVDFSHYLTRAEAEAKDVATLAAIHGFDLPQLMQMGPDYLDSPSSLGVLMLAMKQVGADGPQIVAHTNLSAVITSTLLATLHSSTGVRTEGQRNLLEVSNGLCSAET